MDQIIVDNQEAALKKLATILAVGPVVDKEAKIVEVGRLNTIQGGLLVSKGGLTAELLKEFYTDPK